MTEMAADLGALAEAVSFLGYFNDLKDPRQRGKVMYPLDGMLLLSLIAVLAGAEGFTGIALSGRKKLAFLRRFRPFGREPPRMTRSAPCSPASIPDTSSTVSWPGWPR